MEILTLRYRQEVMVCVVRFACRSVGQRELYWCADHLMICLRGSRQAAWQPPHITAGVRLRRVRRAILQGRTPQSGLPGLTVTDPILSASRDERAVPLSDYT